MTAVPFSDVLRISALSRPRVVSRGEVTPMAVDRESRDELANALGALMREEGKAGAVRRTGGRAWLVCSGNLRRGLPTDLGLMYVADRADEVWPTTRGCMATDLEGWQFAEECLAFLRSDLDWGDEDPVCAEIGLGCGAFESRWQWMDHGQLLDAENLPEYDEKRHNRPPHQVPNWVMIPLLLVAFAGCAVIIGFGIWVLTVYW